MDKVEQLSISLRPEVADRLRVAAAEAGYGSVGEAVGQAVEEWLEARTAAEDTEELRRLVQEGDESGPDLDGEKVFEELIAKYSPPNRK